MTTTYPHACEVLVPLAEIARRTGSPVGHPADICRWLAIDPAAVVEDWRNEPSLPAHAAREVVERVREGHRARLAEKTALSHAQAAERAADDQAREAEARRAAMDAATHAARRGQSRWDLVFAAVAHRVYYGTREAS